MLSVAKKDGIIGAQYTRKTGGRPYAKEITKEAIAGQESKIKIGRTVKKIRC
ncbi:hypothetical protein IZY60_03590 [Lutibacter sp. B2]|nr:hypothetical protein [Lutibacter sp. B2]